MSVEQRIVLTLLGVAVLIISVASGGLFIWTDFRLDALEQRGEVAELECSDCLTLEVSEGYWLFGDGEPAERLEIRDSAGNLVAWTE